MITQNFQIAGGSVIGKDHRRAGKNNQDSLYTFQDDTIVIGIVCDGCSSAKYSEVGAELGARLVGESLRAHALRINSQNIGTVLERVRLDVIAQLRVLAAAMGSSLTKVVNELFLFTIVGACITNKKAFIFSLGDGVYALNGEITEIGPFEYNAPPYIAYGIVSSTLHPSDSPLLRFTIHEAVSIDAISSLVIGSDGITEFTEREEDSLPGKDQPLGPLSQFWEQDRYFKNPDMVRRRLFLANREVTRYDDTLRQNITAHGLFSDDTTLVVIRRTPEEEGS